MAITFKASTSGQSVAGNTFSCTSFDSLDGDFIGVLFTWYNLATRPTIADNLGNTGWIYKTDYGTHDARHTIAYKYNAVCGAGHIVDITGTGFYGTAIVFAFKGVPIGSDPFGVQNGDTAAAGTSTDINGGVTPSVADSVIIAGLALDGSFTGPALSDSFTGLVSIPYASGANFGAVAAYKIQSGGPTLTNPTWTWTTAAASATSAATFAPAVTGSIATLIPTVEVAVELSGAGAGWTDITKDVARDQPVTIRHGIDGVGPTDRVASTPTAVFQMLNSGAARGDGTTRLLGYYSLHHANKRSGWALNIGCRIRIQDPATLTYWTRFIGKIDVLAVQPGLEGQRRVAVTAVGWMDEAARWALTPEIGEQLDKRGDEILTNILAAMPVQPIATSFDLGREAYPYALDTSASGKQSAMTEFAKLAASEFGYIFEKANGTLKYEGRHTRLLTAASAWTITDVDLCGEESALDGLSGRDAIINTARVTAHPKIVDVAPTTIVYDQVNDIPIPAGATKVLLGTYRDPVTGDTIGATNVQPLVANTDYTFNSQESGGGSDLSGSLIVTVAAGPSGARFTIQNTGGTDGWLTSLQQRGQGIYDRASLDAEARDASSVATYGERVVTLDMPYQAVIGVAQGAADYIVLNEAAETARAQTVKVIGKDTATLTQILIRDISDRVTVQETVTGFNAAFFINAIELTVLPSGFVTATYTLVRLQQNAYWILGTSTLGTDTIPAPF